MLDQPSQESANTPRTPAIRLHRFSPDQLVVIRRLYFSTLAHLPRQTFDLETPAIHDALEFLDNAYAHARQRIDDARSRCSSIMNRCREAPDHKSRQQQDATRRILQDIDALHRRIDKACNDLWVEIREGHLERPKTRVTEQFDALDTEAAALHAQAEHVGTS